MLLIGMLQVVDAMRQTIANYLGGLPPEYFSVEISAKGEDLAQLMYTMMMTGYMFRNVQYKLDLHTNMLPQGQLILLTPPHPNRLSPLPPKLPGSSFVEETCLSDQAASLTVLVTTA